MSMGRKQARRYIVKTGISNRLLNVRHEPGGEPVVLDGEYLNIAWLLDIDAIVAVKDAEAADAIKVKVSESGRQD